MAERVKINTSASVAVGVLEAIAKAFSGKFQGQKAGEDDQAFRIRITRAIASAEDTEWDALGEVAQQWYNDAAEAMNNAKDLPDFTKEAPATVVVAKETAPAPKAEVAKPAAAKETAPVAVAKPADASKKKPATQQIRELVCVNPEITPQDAVNILKEAGETVILSTASAVIFDTRKTLDVLRELDMLKEVPKE